MCALLSMWCQMQMGVSAAASKATAERETAGPAMRYKVFSLAQRAMQDLFAIQYSLT